MKNAAYPQRNKRRLVGRREIIVMIAAVILTTAGIKASDNIFNAGTGEGSLSNPCGEDMVLVRAPESDFCVDKYEASAGPACGFSDPASQIETRENLNSRDCAPVSRAGASPWRHISQNQAAAACAKAGKRLPTNKEWLLAAFGTPDKLSGWDRNDCQVANNWLSQPGPAGAGADCVSAAGAYDMIGNVWEWVDGSVHNGSFENRVLPKSGYVQGVDSDAMPSETAEAGHGDYYHDYFWLKESGTRGMARGGYWANNSQAGQYALYSVVQPSETGPGIGFRCVK